MASPQYTDLHIDAALTNWATEYASQRGDLIAHQVAPIIPVTKQSDYYWAHGAEKYQLVETNRAPGAHYGETKWTKSNDSYAAKGYGIMARVPDEDIKNADPEVDPVKDAISVPLEQMLLDYEYQVAALAFSTSEFTQTSALSGTDRWDTDTSDPVNKASYARDYVRGKIGREPNTAVLGYDVFRALQEHSGIRKIVFGLNGKESMPTEAQIAEALGLDRVLVGRATYYSAANTFTDIWGKYALFAYIDPNPTSRSICPLKTFAWTGENPRMATRGPVWDDDTKSWKWYVDDYRDVKKTSLYSAYLYSTVVS